MLRTPTELEIVRSRLWKYLALIRVLHLVDSSQREITLWAELSQLLDSPGPLLPNLQRLDLSFQQSVVSDESLMLLLPFTLQSITTTLRCDSPQPVSEATLTIYRTLASRQAALEAISCHETVHPDLFSTLTSFPTLNSLSITHENKIISHKSDITIQELVERLPSLTSLRVDVGIFPPPTSYPAVSLDQCKLRNMELTASQEDFLRFPHSRFFHLETLTLHVHPTKVLIWEILFEKVAQTFPNMDTLTIDVPERVECPTLRISDLGAFLSRHMATLQLKHVPYHLVSQDLITMLKKWPFLRRLALSGHGAIFDPLTLVAISQSRHLRFLSLRIDCMSLIHFPPDPPPSPQKALREICLISPTWTSTLKNAAILARNFRSIFPNLKIVNAEGAIVSDLQDAIKTLDFTKLTV